MYVLIVIGLVVVVMMVETSAWGLSGMVMLFDMPSFILLMIIGVSMLLATGLGRDFLTAFRLALGKERQMGLRERQRAVEAVELFMKTLRYGGVFGMVLQFISIHSLLEDVSMWSVHLAVLLILPLYAYAINLLLLPIRSRLKLGIIEYMQEIGAEDEAKTDNLQSCRTEADSMGRKPVEKIGTEDGHVERKSADRKDTGGKSEEEKGVRGKYERE